MPGASSYVAPAGFPTTAFSSYYAVPSGQEPQPALYDPVLNITYPLNLTNPDTLPDNDYDPIFFPKPTQNLSDVEQRKTIADTIIAATRIIYGDQPTSNCTRCKKALELAQVGAHLAPTMVPQALVEFCNATGYDTYNGCYESFASTTFGSIWTQVLSLSPDLNGLDGEYICNHLDSSFCPFPAVTPLDINDWFAKPKPADAASRVPKASGERVKVLHMSDFHLDPRYKVGAEGNCTGYLCCRTNVLNTDIPLGQISYPAPLYGAFECDTPYDLGLAALQAVGPLTGTSKDNPLAWTVYTGDLVSHDPQTELSRMYTTYAEDSIFYMFGRYLTGPVFPVLGNHDTNPACITSDSISQCQPANVLRRKR